MLTSYWYALEEAFSRRVSLVVFGVALLIANLFNLLVKIRSLPNGKDAIFLGPHLLGTSRIAVRSVLEAEFHVAGTLWLLLAVFAAVPLVASTLEKGWLELTFSKGTPRWRVFFGRFLAGVTLYFLTVVLATFPLGLRLWWKTGIATWGLAIALLIQTFSLDRKSVV